MIGAAAIALFAGTGLAAAQGNREHSSAPAATGSTGSTKMDQGGKMDQGAKMNQGADKSAQDMKAKPETSTQATGAEEEGKAKGERKGKTHNAQTPSKSKNAQTESAPSKSGKEASENGKTSAEQKGKMSAEQKGAERGKTDRETSEHGRMSAEQKGGGGAHVKLSSEQRSKIHRIVINEHNAPRVAHVDFDVRVGSVIPRGKVHVVRVPQTIVEIEPQWRGFMYFLVGDQIVIVEPDTLRIVAVIAA
jgi:hypothetical protein